VLFLRLVQSGHLGRFFISESPFEEAFHSCFFAIRWVDTSWVAKEGSSSQFVSPGSGLVFGQYHTSGMLAGDVTSSYLLIELPGASLATEFLFLRQVHTMESEAMNLDSRHRLATCAGSKASTIAAEANASNMALGAERGSSLSSIASDVEFIVECCSVSEASCCPQALGAIPGVAMWMLGEYIIPPFFT